VILRRLRIVAATVLALAGTASHAHNFHMGIADISYNERTGSTEIVHTYTAHDLATLLTNLYGRQFDLAAPTARRRYGATLKSSSPSPTRMASACRCNGSA
jgi:hypothetical protein